jgi:RimJ/RimL family protein N-acetyltransferase
MLRLRNDVRLASLTGQHAQTMYQWMRDPVVSRNLGLRSEPSLEKTVSWIRQALEDPTVHPFAILVCEQHVGNVVLDRLDDYLATARFSIYVGEPSARQSGVGLTAAYLALLHGFQEIGLHKIWLTVHTQNIAAINTYAKLGFALEGILRDEFWLDGHRLNALYMGLLRSEFAQLATTFESKEVIVP